MLRQVRDAVPGRAMPHYILAVALMSAIFAMPDGSAWSGGGHGEDLTGSAL